MLDTVIVAVLAKATIVGEADIVKDAVNGGEVQSVAAAATGKKRSAALMPTPASVRVTCDVRK